MLCLLLKLNHEEQYSDSVYLGHDKLILCCTDVVGQCFGKPIIKVNHMISLKSTNMAVDSLVLCKQ